MTGQAAIDPLTGEPLVRHDRMVTGRNGFLYLGPVPVFYWPYVATDATEPSYYIRSFSLRNDEVLGFQVLSGWDGYQIFGIRDKPEGTRLGHQSRLSFQAGARSRNNVHLFARYVSGNGRPGDRAGRLLGNQGSRRGQPRP